VVGLAVLVAVGAFVLWPQPDRITGKNFRRIKEGMSRHEVEGILGGPAGDYRSVETAELFPAWIEFSHLAASELAKWQGDAGNIVLGFDDAERVTLMEMTDVMRLDRGPLDTLRWRAERLWRKWFQ
jgi:hypothetical protein